VRGASRLRLTDVFASPNAHSERHNPIESRHLEAVRIAIGYHLDRQRQLRSPNPHIPHALIDRPNLRIRAIVACACILGLVCIATPRLRARSRSLRRKLDRIRPDRVNWHPKGSRVLLRRPLPASNRPTIAGITPSKSSLGMKSYKVRFTWQQGEACATSQFENQLR
jgi:hypothetical protein